MNNSIYEIITLYLLIKFNRMNILTSILIPLASATSLSGQVTNLSSSKEAPFPTTCGGCWCIPEGGTYKGKCPEWTPPTTFDQETIDGFRNIRLENPWGELKCNPYSDASCQTTPP